MPQIDEVFFTQRQQYGLKHIRASDAVGKGLVKFRRATPFRFYRLQKIYDPMFSRLFFIVLPPGQ